MKKFLLFATLLLVGCLGTNRDVCENRGHERIWWREKNAPEWNDCVHAAPIDSDAFPTTVACVISHRCPIINVIKFDLKDE